MSLPRHKSRNEEGRRRWCGRRFLNDADMQGRAYVRWVIVEGEDWNNAFHIADCTHEVGLEFKLGTQSQRDRSLRKIDRVIRELQRVRRIVANLEDFKPPEGE